MVTYAVFEHFLHIKEKKFNYLELRPVRDDFIVDCHTILKMVSYLYDVVQFANCIMDMQCRTKEKKCLPTKIY